jgi:hypothetical protein
MLFMRGAGNANWDRGNLYLRDLVTGAETLKYDVRGDYTVSYDWQDGTNNIVFDWACSIYAFSPGQTSEHQIIGGDCYDDAPAVNPVDGTISFHNANGLNLADASGANVRGVPNTQSGDLWPQWSPDGQWLSFNRTSQTNLFKIRPDGSGLAQLTFSSGSDSFVNAPAPWSPDLTGLYTVAKVKGVQGIYFVDANSVLGPQLVKSSPENDFDVVSSVIIAPPVSAP